MKSIYLTPFVENVKELYHSSLLTHGYSLDFEILLQRFGLTLGSFERKNTQRPVVSTWNSAIYGAMKHVPHICLFGYA